MLDLSRSLAGIEWGQLMMSSPAVVMSILYTRSPQTNRVVTSQARRASKMLGFVQVLLG
jgi:hypothetical protein